MRTAVRTTCRWLHQRCVEVWGMAARRRLRLVPNGCVEAFEVRAVLYFDAEGRSYVAVDVAEPDGSEAGVQTHEVLGVLRYAEAIWIEKYADT